MSTITIGDFKIYIDDKTNSVDCKLFDFPSP